MATKPHPSWSLVEDHYEQEYGCQEALYARIAVPPGHRGLFLIGTHLGFKYTGSVKDLAPLFRQAWIQMRHKFPGLAASTTDRVKIYKPALDTVLDSWIAETFKVHREMTGQELFRDMTKSAHATLHYLPESSEILLQTEHHHLDGVGLLYFWDELFKAVITPQEVQFGDEMQRLPPRSDDILPMKELWDGQGKALAMEMLAPLATDKPVCMPVDVKKAPMRNFSQEYRFDVRTTAAILRECKNREYTITAVWHVSMALAIRDIQTADPDITCPGTTFANFANFNMRRHFPPGLHEATVGNYHWALPCALDLGEKSFDKLAREMTAFYRKGLTSDVWCALKPMIEEVTPAFTSESMTDSTPAVSSLGNLEQFISRKYGSDWEIMDAWVGDTVTGPWIEGFMWTWRDRMVFSSTYNSGFYKAWDVQNFHETVAQTMKKGLRL
ncbi:hypothetical protein F5Y15DRAFT_104603 [Xylariaceae sp. FL0016]|nr:hypothetical protein F5Y15DRAFT_104603 [Xylariaceae sp. FL0016]